MKLESQMIIIFGATGDLSRRKLIPSLYHLIRKQRLSNCTPIVCVGRRDLTRDEFIEHLSIAQYIKNQDPEVMEDLMRRISYVSFDMENGSSEEFITAVDSAQKQYGCTDNKLIYFALPTSIFEQTVKLIGRIDSGTGWRRIVFEKPFGTDLHSARRLDAKIRAVLEEDEIYRVDHYLGKELVQNILTLRFANEIFSGVWGAHAIDHVQITVSETLGVEKRAGYYDKSGAVRDMIQNHLLQLLSFVTMEPPSDNSSDALRDNAEAVMKNLRPLQKTDIVLGQYGTGTVDSETVVAYRSESGVEENSNTETYAAIRAFIDNNRWRGMPFYLRTGKRLRQRHADIKIVFRQCLRAAGGNGGKPNLIIIRIQPDEGIALTVNVQKPGEEDTTVPVLMDFCHHCHFGPNTPEAYESILHNVMEGDHSLFPRQDWIEASWQYVDRLRRIAAGPAAYNAGSSGPAEADTLLEADGRKWLDEEPAAAIISLPSMNEVLPSR
ncbi:MAG: glucose-6-phosphate dehydrogenase [Desulfocapsaceae bacterium]|jgi:glucose-6-phosphate 1-dehydrogenase|nr:glucose-6-phosphate dehydrogenase [Desulfocapsaceae bacterium]